MDLATAVAIEILFQALKDKKKLAKLRPALAKIYLTIQRLASSDNQLAELINPKPNA
jgi:hypothetical protein